MSDQHLERMGAACGIVYAVLLIAGGSIGGPDIRIAFFVEVLAFLFYLFFLGTLWGALRRAEGGSGWLSTTAFGAGLGGGSCVHRQCARIQGPLPRVQRSRRSGRARKAQ